MEAAETMTLDSYLDAIPEDRLDQKLMDGASRVTIARSLSKNWSVLAQHMTNMERADIDAIQRDYFWSLEVQK